MIGTRLAERYELLEEAPHSVDGRLFRARDLALSETVAVKILEPECLGHGAAVTQLEAAFRRAQCTPHPHLLRHYSFDSTSGLLVREWVHGISLLDLLRRRRELGDGEAFFILSALPATLDFLAGRNFPLPRPLLGKIFLRFDSAVSPDEVSNGVIQRWPPFSLKLNALSVRTLLADDSGESDRTMIVETHPAHAAGESHGPTELAALLYELLGGRTRDARATRFSPLSSLTEEANTVLLRTLLKSPYTHCRDLWRALLAAQCLDLRPTAPLHSDPPQPAPPLLIPAKLIGGVQPGTSLIFSPLDESGSEIHLIARPHFTIGRSPQMADFVTRVMPETPENEVITNRLSRIHVLAEAARGRFLLRDGNGASVSLNGSFLDGQRISPEHPTSLVQRSLLSLGTEYSLELIPLLHILPRPLTITNGDAWAGPSEPLDGPLGALVCEPREGQPVLRQSVWLLTEIGFGLDYNGRLVWDTRGLGDSPAAFHYHRGCFWLRNAALVEGEVKINKTALRSNDIAPLVSGQIVRLGSATFKVEIE